jgi:hypothetical protein
MSLDYMHIIHVGDTSGDGHDKTITYKIQTNLPANEIIKAYKTYCNRYGISLTDTGKDNALFVESEDWYLTQANALILSSSGIDLNKVFSCVDKKKDFRVYENELIPLFMEMVKVIRSDFEWKEYFGGPEEDLQNALEKLGGNFGYGLIDY